MQWSSTRTVILFLAVPLLSGCLGDYSGPSSAGRTLLLDAEPDGAVGVVAMKQALQPASPTGDESTTVENGATSSPTSFQTQSGVIIGRVGGGSHETWTPGEAAFLVRDLDLNIEQHGHDGTEPDDCPFCQAEQAKQLDSMVLVRMVDDQGSVIPSDAKTLLGLDMDDIVVAEGTAVLDKSNTFVFDAQKIYVKSE